MNYEKFKQEIEKYDIVTKDIYEKLEKKYGKNQLERLFEIYINDDNIPNDDEKFNRTSYYIEYKMEEIDLEAISDEDKLNQYRNNDFKSYETTIHGRKYYDPVKLYFQEISEIPLLSKEEERELATKIYNLKEKIAELKLTDEYFETKLKELNYPNKVTGGSLARKKQLKYVKQTIEQLEEKKEKLTAVSKNSSDKEIKGLLENINLKLNELNILYENLNIQYNYHKNVDKFAESNLRLVASIAKKYTGRGLDLLDLIQEGNIGLSKAIDKFDVNKGYKFSTYATWWINQAVARSIGEQSRIIRLPVHVYETLNRFKRAEKYIVDTLGKEATAQELSEYLQLPLSKIHELKKIKEVPVSLSTPIGDDEGSILGDFVEDSTQKIEENALNSLLSENLKEALSTLTEREEQVLRLRFGLEDGIEKTLEEVGKELKVTRERVRQIESRALKKLRHPKLSDNLKDFLN